jgi:hypothetical protein
MATVEPVAVTKLVATLRRYAPARVRAWDANDKATEIAVPNVRSRWTRVAATIEARAWVRCELLNKDGAVLGYVDNDGPAGDVEDLGDNADNAKQNAWLNTMLRAQQVALTYQAKEVSELLRGCTEMMRVQSEAMKQLAGMYQAQVQVAVETAAMQAQDNTGDIEKALAIIEAVPDAGTKLLPLIAGLRGVLTGQLRPAIPGVAAAGKKPTNGTPTTKE